MSYRVIVVRSPEHHSHAKSWCHDNVGQDWWWSNDSGNWTWTNLGKEENLTIVEYAFDSEDNAIEFALRWR